MMKWLQTLRQKFPQHKYAIDVQQLGDSAALAWSNLGYWQGGEDYPQACRQLADHLAQAVGLNAADRILDLGCGQGASLLHWQQHYQIQSIEAVELQKHCVEGIGQYTQVLPALKVLHSQSFLDLTPDQFLQPFDVILCIDAAYHHRLGAFLNVATALLKPGGRLGFHTLILAEDWPQASHWQKYTSQLLLAAADVKLAHLYSKAGLKARLQQSALDQVHIEDISATVFSGFADYVADLYSSGRAGNTSLESYKIRMTAKLCARLYTDGLIRYVQVSAVKSV